MNIQEKSIRNFENYLLENERAALTVQKYSREVLLLLEYMGGKEITKEKMLEYRERLAEQFSVRTVNSKISAVNTYLQFCGKEDCKLRLLKVQRQVFVEEDRQLTEKDYKRLLDAAGKCGQKRLYYLLLTLVGTGIRISELRFITVNTVATRRAQIRLKGKIRTVIIPKELAVKLMRYIREKGIQNGPVFCTRSGRSLDRSNICHDMKRLCRSAGVDERKVYPHNFRHLFARVFYAVEKNLAYLADILGHSSIETTRIYVAATTREHENIMRKMQLVI